MIQEAEEIIENYIKKQTELSRKFQIKSKRKIRPGIFLLLGALFSVLLWVAVLLLIF